jgi:hypothetical protein
MMYDRLAWHDDGWRWLIDPVVGTDILWSVDLGVKLAHDVWLGNYLARTYFQPVGNFVVRG